MWRAPTVSTCARHMARLAQGPEVIDGVVVATLNVVNVVARLAAPDALVVVSCEDSAADVLPVWWHFAPAFVVTSPGHWSYTSGYR